MSSKAENTSLTVVTVTFNSVNTLEACLRSVCNQTEKKFVHLVIDGGSSDDSVSLLSEKGYVELDPRAKVAEAGRYFVSEIDRGVYDAMNTGLSLTDTSHVIFLNSDDYFVDCHVVRRIIQNLVSYELQLHGICYRENGRDRVFRPVSITAEDVIFDKSLRRAPHPCIVFPVTELRYDLRHQLASDYEYVIESLLKFGPPKVFDECATVMVRSTSQLSVRHRNIMLSESNKIAKSYNLVGNLKVRFNLLLWGVKNIVPVMTKKLGIV